MVIPTYLVHFDVVGIIIVLPLLFEALWIFSLLGGFSHILRCI